MHHDSKLTRSREPGIAETCESTFTESRGCLVVRPRSRAAAFGGWGPKLG